MCHTREQSRQYMEEINQFQNAHTRSFLSHLFTLNTIKVYNMLLHNYVFLITFLHYAFCKQKGLKFSLFATMKLVYVQIQVLLAHTLSPQLSCQRTGSLYELCIKCLT